MTLVGVIVQSTHKNKLHICQRNVPEMSDVNGPVSQGVEYVMWFRGTPAHGKHV